MVNKDNKFKIGDTVKVINAGCIYPDYDSMFKRLGFKNTKKNEPSREIILDKTWVIFNIEKNKDYRPYTALCCGNLEILISQNALLLVNPIEPNYETW